MLNDIRPFVRLVEGDVKVIDPETGRFRVTIIEAGPGNKRNKHFYPKEMLERDANKYTGRTIYKNHEHPREAMKRGGLPRPVEDIGGLIERAWFEPNGGQHGRGAVVGEITLVDRHMVNIARHTPTAIGLSHNARATSVKPSLVAGDKHFVVEGIEEVKSVDLVTLAGAGGKIDSMLESELEETMLDSVTLDDLREHRPDLLEAHTAELREAEGGKHNDKDFDTKLQEALDVKLQEAVKETEDRLNTEHSNELQVAKNLRIVDQVLLEAELPTKSREDIAKDFTHPLYELVEAKEGVEAIAPEAQLREALQTAIKEKQVELAEATGSGKIKGMGSGSGDGKQSRPTPLHDHIAGYITKQ